MDLLACDANVSPETATGIVSAFVPALRRGATLVLTFKDATKGYAEWRRQMESATDALTAAGSRRRGFSTCSVTARGRRPWWRNSRAERRETCRCGGSGAGGGEFAEGVEGRGQVAALTRPVARCLRHDARGVCRGAHQGQGVRAAAERSVRLMRGRLLKILSDEVIAESSWHAS